MRHARRHLAFTFLGGLAAWIAVSAPAPSAMAAELRPVPLTPVTDQLDVSEYLSYWKAADMARALQSTTAATGNQLAYDVHFYDLDLHPDIPTKTLFATVKTVATVTAGPLTTLDLDLDDVHMIVDAVTSGGTPTTFTHAAELLTIQLDRSYATGEDVEVTVTYHGQPGGGTFAAPMSFSTLYGQPLVATLSEPFDARAWWPCKDDAADKADSVDIRTTMPSGMLTASNGVLADSSDNGTTAYTHWKSRHPISTYLVSIASYPYVTQRSYYVPSPGDTMPIVCFVPASESSLWEIVNGKIKNMIAAFAARYGEYPFVDEKYGQARMALGGGMEHQTCTSTGTNNESVAAHELCHQWFGDAVTCRDFHHIWLNEGFATFGEAIWSESTGGIANYHAKMNAAKYFGAGTVYCPDLSDVNRIFNSSLTYRRGAWVLHMLRHVVGDGPFFASMLAYRQQFEGSNATTEDFQQVCETVSGRDLDKFFQQWVYGEYYPAYEFITASAPAGGGGYDVTVQLRQTQTWQKFWMPVDVRVQTGVGTYTFVARDSLPLQFFTFNVPEAPTSVQLDPDEWVLRTVTTPTAVNLPGDTGAALRLASPQPNPMGASGTLAYAVPRSGSASLRVVDAAGRRVAELVSGRIDAGEHRVVWNGRGADGRRLSAGVYWAQLEFEGERRVQRLAILN